MDYYKVLGIPPTASAAEVRKAYMRLARERHPDRFVDPEEKAQAHDFFRDLTTAFNTLSNDRLRREYDQEREQPQARTPVELAAQAHATGLELYRAGNLAQAIEALRIAVHHAPQELAYVMDLARALASHPRSAREAAEVLEGALRLAPQSVKVHRELAALLLGQGLTVRARRVAEAALRLAPNDPQVQDLVARCGGGDTSSKPGPAGGLLDRIRRRT